MKAWYTLLTLRIVQGDRRLDVIPGSKACTIILDDKRSVWRKEDRENLIEMVAYNFFASSCQSSYPPHKSLSELKIDKREADGTLASILDVLKRAYQQFLVMDSQITAVQPDVRSILKDMRK
ncbi:RNA polymerase II C-terminal domain phosphatase-like 4 [Carex littledalei]|uniref:protein-serine/threonine phosphatase n=1 Tax=Carex littledalei TaxID=544730 RepID=A0A833VJH5_9POAL|nr:RNA polymerase II C-terminal domain phosphatase-like 4 [Carex littledalei]